MGIGTLLLLGCLGNSVMFGVELLWGIWSGSMALVADSLHLASDAVAWGLAGLAEWFSRRGASRRYTFGREKANALAAGLGVLLLAFVVIRDVIPEAVGRLSDPQAILSTPMLIVAVIGGLWNLLLLILLPERGGALHIRSARLHGAFDFLGSVVVVAAAALIKATGWFWWDSVGSLAVVAMVAIPAWATFRAALEVLLDKAPPFPWEEFERFLGQVRGVQGWHEVHLWPVGGQRSLTIHILRDPNITQETLDAALKPILHKRFRIAHHTIRTELVRCDEACMFQRG